MIYTLRRSPRNEVYLDGYSHCIKGLCAMAHAYVREYFNYEDTLAVSVDDGIITVIEPDGDEYDFYISEKHEFTGEGWNECT
jgi:hypothetical protein